MKNLIYGFIALIALVSACDSRKEAKVEDEVEWKEMDEFHAVMADMYHPLKDSNNLEPIRKSAGEFSAAASKWAGSKLPARVDNDDTRKLLSQLEEGSKALEKMVEEGSPDEEVASRLTALHDTFHSIMESWYSAGKEEGAEEHHDH